MYTDAMKTKDAVSNIITHLHENSIDISRIQETHNGSTEMIIRNGYGIYPNGKQDQATKIQKDPDQYDVWYLLL